MKPAGNGNKKRKNQWKKRRWQWKEACTLSWTRHSQKGVQPPRWPYPGTWAGGPTPWLTLPRDLAGGIVGGGGVKNRFFFLHFPRKKTKKTQKKQKNAKKTQKKKQKKTKKKRFGRTPPSRRGGPPKFPATFTTFPDGAAKSAKFPPNLAKVHVPRRLVTIRGILFHLQAPKVGWHSQRKRLQVFFLLFFSNCFFSVFFFLFYCFFVCFFLFFCFFFFKSFFLLFSKWLNRFFCFCFFLKMRFTELAWTVHHKVINYKNLL